MTELKPCPFCGGEAEYGSTTNEDWGYVSHFVTCKNNCLDGLYSMGNTKEEAIEAWNNRPSPWHTGTPTEEGWYLVAFNYEDEEGVRYTTDYFKDGKWAFPMVRDISKVIAWQKIEEKQDGHTD